MNGIAKNVVPTDEQLRCEHIIAVTVPTEAALKDLSSGLYQGPLVTKSNAEYLKRYGGIKATYCMKCGARLEGVNHE